MKNKGLTITGIILAAIAAIVVIVVLCGDAWLTKSMDSFLRKELSSLPGNYANFSTLNIRLAQRTITLEDVEYCSSKDNILPEDSAGMRVHIDRLSIRGFRFFHMIQHKELDIRKLSVEGPDVLVQLPIKKPEPVPVDSTEMEEIEQAESNLRNIIVQTISVLNGRFRMRDITNNLEIYLDSLNVNLHDIGYHFGDSTYIPENEARLDNFLYNDSLYTLSLRNFTFVSDDSLVQADVKYLRTQNAGPVVMRGVHAFNTCNKGELAYRKGQIPVVWMDAMLDEIATSPVNLIRQGVAREFVIDSINIAGNRVHVLQDQRFDAKKPFPMPQDELLGLEVPFVVNTVSSFFPRIDVEVLTTYLENCGALELLNVDAKMFNVTNKLDEQLLADVHSQFGHGGTGHIIMSLKMDKAAHYSLMMHCQDLKGSTFDKFIHPLFGADLQCNIHEMQTNYAGDREGVKGDFCMRYDSLKVHVTKEDAPYAAIAKHAGAINVFASMIIKPSNPRKAGEEPRVYTIEAKRNPMLQFPVTLLMPMMDGIMQTLLPDFAVKIVHKKQAEKAKGKKELKTK